MLKIFLTVVLMTHFSSRFIFSFFDFLNIQKVSIFRSFLGVTKNYMWSPGKIWKKTYCVINNIKNSADVSSFVRKIWKTVMIKAFFLGWCNGKTYIFDQVILVMNTNYVSQICYTTSYVFIIHVLSVITILQERVPKMEIDRLTFVTP